MVKIVVVGLAMLAVWLLLPMVLPAVRWCPLVVVGQPVSLAALLAVAVGVLGWRAR